MEQVSAFKSQDGALWATEEACKEHETALRWREKINEYRESELCPYKRGAHFNMTEKVIVSWEMFKVKQLEVVK